MDTFSTQLVLIIAVAIPILIYLRNSKKLKKPDNYKEFLTAPNQVTSSQFANSATAYNFQVASLSFFFMLGFICPLAGIINVLFWYLGIFLFFLITPRLERYYGSHWSLPGYLEEVYQSPLLRKIISILIFLGFTGLLLAELLFGSLTFIAIGLSQTTTILLAFLFAVFILIYYSKAGHLAVIYTDERQIVVSYLGFFSVMTWSLLSIRENTGSSITIVSAVIAFVLIVSLYIHAKAYPSNGKDEKQSKTSPEKLITALFILMTIILLFFGVKYFPQSDSKEIITLISSTSNSFSPYTYLSAFVILPLFWQFGDATHWHRLAALRIKANGASRNDLDSIKRGILRFGFQSSTTIIFPIALGILFHFVSFSFTAEEAMSPTIIIPSLLLQGNILSILFGVLFVSALIGIMMSTVDGFLATSVLIFTTDISNKTRKLIAEEDANKGESDTSNRIIKFSIQLASYIIIISLCMYLLLYIFSVDLFAWLFFGFSIPLSIVPSVMTALFSKNPEKYRLSAIISTIGGTIGGIAVFIYSQNNQDWALYPPGTAILISFILFLFFSPFKSKT